MMRMLSRFMFSTLNFASRRGFADPCDASESAGSSAAARRHPKTLRPSAAPHSRSGEERLS